MKTIGLVIAILATTVMAQTPKAPDCGAANPNTQLNVCELGELHAAVEPVADMQKRIAFLQGELPPLIAKQNAAVAKLLAAHPGMVYEKPSLKYPEGRLVKK